MNLLDKSFSYGKVGDWSWVLAHLPLFWSLSLTHLYIALAAVIIGFVVALPLGALAVGAPRIYLVVLSVTTVLYAVPSLAVFAFLIGVTGLTDVTVIAPLAVYALAIMVRSVADGLSGVSDEVRLAATAMGYRPLRRVWSVELPAAMPVIIAGFESPLSPVSAW
jgi:osmoprotectant transport system permease protein